MDPASLHGIHMEFGQILKKKKIISEIIFFIFFLFKLKKYFYLFIWMHWMQHAGSFLVAAFNSSSLTRNPTLVL